MVGVIALAVMAAIALLVGAKWVAMFLACAMALSLAVSGAWTFRG